MLLRCQLGWVSTTEAVMRSMHRAGLMCRAKGWRRRREALDVHVLTLLQGPGTALVCACMSG